MQVSFTPYNKVELLACLNEIDRWLQVTVTPTAAEVLEPWKLSTVGDVLELICGFCGGRSADGGRSIRAQRDCAVLDLA